MLCLRSGKSDYAKSCDPTSGMLPCHRVPFRVGPAPTGNVERRLVCLVA